MSTKLKVKAYSNKTNKEFNKHYNAVKFCLENNLSFPIETSEFFKGKIDGCDLEDFHESIQLSLIGNGTEISIKTHCSDYHNVIIYPCDIPDEVDKIIISLD